PVRPEPGRDPQADLGAPPRDPEGDRAQQGDGGGGRRKQRVGGRRRYRAPVAAVAPEAVPQVAAAPAPTRHPRPAAHLFRTRHTGSSTGAAYETRVRAADTPTAGRDALRGPGQCSTGRGSPVKAGLPLGSRKASGTPTTHIMATR